MTTTNLKDYDKLINRPSWCTYATIDVYIFHKHKEMFYEIKPQKTPPFLVSLYGHALQFSVNTDLKATSEQICMHTTVFVG